MKLLSYNIRALAGRVKKRDFSQLIKIQKPDLLCLQQSKLELVDRRLCSMLWYGDDFEWVIKEEEGRAGVLIIIWNKNKFELNSNFSGNSYLVVEGWWGAEKTEVTIMNVHAL